MNNAAEDICMMYVCAIHVFVAVQSTYKRLLSLPIHALCTCCTGVLYAATHFSPRQPIMKLISELFAHCVSVWERGSVCNQYVSRISVVHLNAKCVGLHDGMSIELFLASPIVLAREHTGTIN